MTAAEIAQPIAHLASPLASAITATLFAVGGGTAGVRLPEPSHPRPSRP